MLEVAPAVQIYNLPLWALSQATKKCFKSIAKVSRHIPLYRSNFNVYLAIASLGATVLTGRLRNCSSYHDLDVGRW